MSTFQSLDHHLPLNLQGAAADIAKAVWREYSGLKIPMLDEWWHRASLMYIPNADGTVSALILNCIEGESDQPSQRAAYVVDFVRRRVKVKDGSGSYKAIPADVVAKVDQIRKWVDEIPQRKAEGEKRMREERRNAELKAKKANFEALKAYERRLSEFRGSQPPVAKRRKVEIKQTATSKTGQCPDCETPLEYCKRCRILSCARKDCAGQGSDLLRRCKDEGHAHEIYCAKCRDSQAQHDPMKPLLAACPVCLEDRCLYGLRICDGKEGGDKAVHDARVICCVWCEKKPTADPSHTVYSCINPACATLRVCGDCAAAHGRMCEEHPAEWWCKRGGCADSPKSLCPSCDSLLCPDILGQLCEVCKKPSSCALCITEQQHKDAATHKSEATEKVKDTPDVESSKCLP